MNVGENWKRELEGTMTCHLQQPTGHLSELLRTLLMDRSQADYSITLLSLTELPKVLPESIFATKPTVFCLIHGCRKQSAAFFSAAAFYVFENYYHVSASFSLPQIAQSQLVQSFIAGHVF